LTQASHKVAEAMYKQASQAGGGGQPGAGPEGGAAGASAGKADDDIVDADFEEVNEDKK
jgi:molecular chaperone DnaK